jgi:hypothetical protein
MGIGIIGTPKTNQVYSIAVYSIVGRGGRDFIVGGL